MIPTLKKGFYKSLLVSSTLLLLLSCNNESVENFIVERQEMSEYSYLSLASDLLFKNIKSEATPEQEEIINSFKNVSVLHLKSSEVAPDFYTSEKVQLESILDKSNFKKLINVNIKGIDGVLFYKGEENSIDEFIFFGHRLDNNKSDEMGLIRVLGDNIDLSKVFSFMKDLDHNEHSFKDFKNIFENFNFNQKKTKEA